MFIFDSIEEKEKEEEEGEKEKEDEGEVKEEKEEEEEEVDGKWQGTNGNCRRGFNLAAVIFKDGAGQGFILFRILCNDRLMWVIVAVSADYRGFRPLQGRYHSHTGVGHPGGTVTPPTLSLRSFPSSFNPSLSL